MKKVFRLIIVFACFLMQGPVLFGQDAASPNISSSTEFTFTEITVRGHRELNDSIFNTTKISVTDNYRRSLSLDKNLEGLPGIDVKNYGSPGSLATFSVRGGTANQSLVTIEDVPMNDIELGSFDLSVFPVSMFSGIEVIRDGGSSIFGPNASSGYVGLSTPDVLEKSFVRINPGVMSYQGMDLSVDGGIKAGNNWSLYPAIHYTTGRNDYQFTYNNTNSIRSNSQCTNFNFSLNAVYKDSLLKLKLFTYFNRKILGTPGWPDQNPNTYQENRDVFTVLKASLNIPLYTEGVFSYRYAWKKVLSYISYLSSYSLSDFEDIQLYSKLSQEADLKVLTALYGLESRYFKVALSTLGPKENLLVSPFISLQKYLFNDALKIGLKARYDIDDVYGNVPTFSGGFNLKLPAKTTLHAGIGTSFREPDLSSLYWPDDGFSKGNPALKPETSVDVDAGVQNRILDFLSLDVSVFRNSYLNLIQWASVNPADPFAYWIPQNVSKALLSGAEAGFELRAQALFDFKFNYMYLLAQDQSGTNTGKILPYEPIHRLTGTANFHLWRLNLSIIGHYQGIAYLNEEMAGSPLNTFKDHLTFDMFLNYEIVRNLSVYASAENITDMRYTTYSGYPVIGRTFKVQAVWKYE